MWGLTWLEMLEFSNWWPTAPTRPINMVMCLAPSFFILGNIYIWRISHKKPNLPTLGHGRQEAESFGWQHTAHSHQGCTGYIPTDLLLESSGFPTPVWHRLGWGGSVVKTEEHATQTHWQSLQLLMMVTLDSFPDYPATLQEYGHWGQESCALWRQGEQWGLVTLTEDGLQAWNIRRKRHLSKFYFFTVK